MLSVIIPFKDEAENLNKLSQLLKAELDTLGQPYEVVLVQNGSTDDWQKSYTPPADNFRVLSLRRGDKGRALRRGVAKSTGDIILFMDADLEDNPHDISKFYAKINEGFDFVNGWRKNRKHTIDKLIPSFIGNVVILRWMLGSKYHDINCGFKMFRRDCLKDVVLYGDNFRFLPLIVEKLAYKTTEVPVAHKNREHGKSKYGFLNRITVFADILTAYFIYRFAQKPLHFFAAIGVAPFVIGVIITVWLFIERVFFGVLLKDRPLVFGGILLILVGLQIILTGIIAELQVYLSRKGMRE
ncbi:MAG: glycosyltransferase [Patescibacteria group bacterium]